MIMETTIIIGKCLDMCPSVERIRRQNEGLVHILESEQDSKKNGALFKKKGDPKKMVKEFVRSGAGKDLTDIEMLRPPDVLYRTVLYLLEIVVINDQVPWPIVYEFISDRLRAVRQDAVVQQMKSEEWLRILPPMVRFHCYSAYRLLEYSSVSLELNVKCLDDCISRLIAIYSEEHNLKYNKEMSEMETLYALINLENMTILTRYVTISQKLRENVSNATLQICKDYIIQNYIGVFNNLNRLPIIHICMFFALYISFVRRYLLQIIAFSSCCGKQKISYSVKKLKNLLVFDSELEVIEECTHYGIQFDEVKQYILFNRDVNILCKDVTKPKKWDILESKLKDASLPKLFLDM